MRNLVLILCLLLLTLSACMPSGAADSASDATETTAFDAVTDEAPAETAAEDSAEPEATIPEHLSIQVGDFTLTLDAAAEEALEALGTPNSITDYPSCAFDGMERHYVYDTLYLRTYTDGDDEERIYGWWFKNDELQTNEGIRIGSTRAEVEAAYGSFTENTCKVTLGSEKLFILLADDIVYSIQFNVE